MSVSSPENTLSASTLTRPARAWWPLALTLALAALNVGLSWLWGGAQAVADTPDYELAVDRVLRDGYDALRPPLYPLCMSVCYKLTPAHWHDLLAAAQVVAFLVAVALLWLAARGLSRSRGLATAAALVYALVPGGPATYAMALIAESLLLSAIAALAYAAWRLWTAGRCAWLLLLALAAACALKPAAVGLLPALAVYVVGMAVRRRRGAWLAVACAAVGLLPLVWQTAQVSRAHGVLSPSVVTVQNRYLLCVLHGPRLAPLARDAAMRDTLDSIERRPRRRPYEEAQALMRHFGARACDSLASAAGAPWVGLTARVGTALTRYRAFYNPVDSPEGHNAYVRFLGRCTPLGWLPFALWPLALAAAAAIAGRQWRRSRRCPWPLLALWLMAAAFVAGALLYAPYAFDRLSLPALAPLLLLLCWRAPDTQTPDYHPYER